PCPICFPQYGLVFDAGSTHTALYIYQWPVDKENGTGIVSQVEACTVSGECAGTCPSLSPSLLGHCPGLSQHRPWTEPLSLRWAKGRWSGGRTKVKCEGERRGTWKVPQGLLSPQNLEGRGRDCDSLQSRLTLAVSWAQFSFAEKWEHPRDTEVLGALDLGGASTQITFEPGVTIEDKNTSVFFRLYGTNYSLYTHSYLCYGQTQALKMLLAALHQVPQPLQISHPCYHKGYQENVTTADLYDSPCVHAPSTPSTAQVLTVTGTGDPAACSSAIQKLFNFSCGANRTCGFNGVYQPPVRGQFFAFSGLYQNLHFLNLTGGQPLSSVNATIWEFCTNNWEKVQKEFPKTNRTHLRDACAASSYAVTLLLQGYKFNHTTWINIHFVQQVANVHVGWSLGYMLNLTNMIPSETPQSVVGLQRINWIAATVLLAVMLILIFCLLTVLCCQKNSGYESL
ncbi:ENTP8 diphosphohydrolase, partial [Steatornis caripensis]|nr:ENTP8 diphosphohydrolase [Steatornis caripensis]